MKRIYKQLIMFLIAITIATDVYGARFVVDGIMYSTLTDSTCAVDYNAAYSYNNPPQSNTYVGIVEIPTFISYGGNKYTVSAIGNYAFYGCEDLVSVILCDSIESIGRGAFASCTKLTSVIFGKKVMESISNEAFKGCSKLTSIEANVEYIGDYAFLGCTSLKTCDFTNSLTKIESNAFQSCENLKYFIIPENVVICRHPFEKCSNLETIVIKGDILETLELGKETPESTKIFIPITSIEKYRNMIDEKYMILPYVDAEICFYAKATLQDYLVETEKYDMNTITSVAFYNGKDDYLTDKWLKTGMNPNCLYYVYPDDVVTGNNVVKISGLTAENIVLQDGYSFRCSTAFNAKNISFSYTPNVWADGKKGWDAICLPFDVTHFKASTKGSISPILLGANGDFWLRKFVGASSDELYFTSTYDGVMKAYTPYIVAFPGSKMGKNNIEGQSVSFIGKDVVVGTEQPSIVQRNDFIFKGGFDTDADEGTGWILNSNGDGFEKTDVVGNNPFHAYFMTDNDDTAAGAKRLSISTEFVEEEGTLVSSVKLAEESLEVVADEGAVIIKANSNTTVNIYGANGALLRCVRINAGENRVEGLAKGLYIINKQKILIR